MTSRCCWGFTSEGSFTENFKFQFKLLRNKSCHISMQVIFKLSFWFRRESITFRTQQNMQPCKINQIFTDARKLIVPQTHKKKKVLEKQTQTKHALEPRCIFTPLEVVLPPPGHVRSGQEESRKRDEKRKQKELPTWVINWFQHTKLQTDCGCFRNLPAHVAALPGNTLTLEREKQKKKVGETTAAEKFSTTDSS